MLNLCVDYSQHPNFSAFSLQSLVEDEALSRFTDLYKESLSLKGKLKCRPAQAAKLGALIISEIGWQHTDVRFQNFFSELAAHVSRLIATESSLLWRTDLEMSDLLPAGRLDNGRFLLTRLESSSLELVIKSCAPVFEHLTKMADEGHHDRSSLSQNAGVENDIIVHELNRAFEREGVIQRLSDYLGWRLRVGGAAIELSVPHARWWKDQHSSSEVSSTAYAHVDEDRTVPKAIIYLSDVADLNGPTSVFPNLWEDMKVSPLAALIGRVIGNVGRSRSSPNRYLWEGSPHLQPSYVAAFQELFMALPTSLRFNSHFGWDVLEGSRLADEMSQREIAILGPIGTAIVFDGGSLVHRGGLVQDGLRRTLQVTFTKERSAPVRVLRSAKKLHMSRRDRPRRG